MSEKDRTRIYTHFGVLLPGGEGTENATGDCPFCGKENHFGVSRETGQYKCWVCASEGHEWGVGNEITFLRNLHEKSKLEYGDQPEAWSGINAATLRRHEIVKSCLTGDWLIPVFSREGKLMNMAKVNPVWDKDNEVWKDRLFFAPRIQNQFKQSLYMLQFFGKNAKRPVLLLEGHKDSLAMDMALHQRERWDEFDILGAPGASSFQQSWIATLAGRPVWAFYDHDKAGRDGTIKLIDLIRETPAAKRPSEFKFINWPDWFTVGFDVHDALLSGIPKPIAV